jgi:hypothetical protein
VGKFETSHPSTSRLPSTTDQSYIKPNQFGISYQNVSTQFATAINMGTNGTGTNITNPANTQNLNNMNVRLSKNSDWGAIAYLSTSIYGRGTSEIYINNCDNNVLAGDAVGGTAGNTQLGDDTLNDRTGWAGATADSNIKENCSMLNTTPSHLGAYHTERGQHASTTDNIYGIYDMSGGNWEYQMAVYNKTLSIDSGFTSSNPLPNDKYLNNYPAPPFSTDANAFSNNNTCTFEHCGGQALHETKTVQSVTSSPQSWNSDTSYFVISSSPWFRRGGGAINKDNSGLFASYNNYGSAYFYDGFRVVGSRF